MSHPPPRVQYNARARNSTAGGSKKKGKRKQNPIRDDGFDANAPIIIPKSKEEVELGRRERLRAELAAQSESKWSSKKRKRLDKYIEKKLKKEERVQILEKLAQTQATLPNSFHLQSSSTLGTGKTTSHSDYLAKAEDKEVRRALDGQASKRRRQPDSYTVIEADEDDDDDDDDERSDLVEDSTVPQLAPAVNSATAVGSALKRNADGSVVAPKFVPRKRDKKLSFKSWSKHKPATVVEEESDSSFDSSDSGNDSSGDEAEPEAENDVSSEREENESPLSGDDPAEPVETAVSLKVKFKDWAQKQLSLSKGYIADPTIPSPTITPPQADEPTQPPRKKRRLSDPKPPGTKHGPLGVKLELPNGAFAQHVLESSSTSSLKYVTISRPPDVDDARSQLPIVREENRIMESILLNPVVVISGETGSGKTTQVPQFLYEHGFGSPGSDNPGMIGVTQPRRVAAMSMAARVAHEMALPTSRVSYQIRYDATVSPTTAIKFMTDGVLLRELATDFLLTKYSVIIIDEAHERSMNTDILIGVLSRVLRLREEMWLANKADFKPLRLVIMSATLRTNDFVQNKTLFPAPPPLIVVEARQHPVTVHFSRRTVGDYVTEAVKKATKIHTRLPPGGILVFLTGQNEITGVCRQLEAKFGAKALERKRRVREQDESTVDVFQPAHADVEAEDVELGSGELALDVDDGMGEDDPEALDTDEEESEEHQLDEELGLDSNGSDVPMHVVPLYSLLPSEKQMQVFQPPPEGSRLVVVSTNVAETSLTIPGIRYVVDCGRAKERRYDVANGIQAFQVGWISKASAAQRAGRAGRTGPGHCYRLFSSALFEHHFDQFAQPEIARMPIEGVVLQMKSMHIDSVVNFPFPTSPDRTTLAKAEKILTHLGALAEGNAKNNGQITDLGRMMALFPLSPRFSRMLVSGQQHGCLPYIISIVSALSVGDPFLHNEHLGENDKDDRKDFYKTQHQHSSLGNFTSDVFRILSVVGAYEFAGGGMQFCQQHFVRPKAMEEIHKLRAQISNIVQANFSSVDAGFDPKLKPPSDLQLKVLRQLLTAGFIDQVAVRKDRLDKSGSGGSGAQYTTAKGVAYRAMGINEDVFIHPSSVLFNVSPPEYVVFSEVVRTSRLWIKGVTVINPVWISSLANSSLCTFSKPTKNGKGDLVVTPRFGSEGWELPPVKAGSVKSQCVL